MFVLSFDIMLRWCWMVVTFVTTVFVVVFLFVFLIVLGVFPVVLDEILVIMSSKWYA